MKIAYLIAAHTDPRHLQRLVKSLFVAGVTDFYIHVDLKSDINAFLQGLNPLGLLDKNLIFGGV